MGTAFLVGLTLLACIGAITPSDLTYSDVLASVSQVCQLEIRLRDDGGDGWIGPGGLENTFSMKTGPSQNPTFAVPLTPLTMLCAALNDSQSQPTIGTLLDSDYCAFTAQIPAGWSIEFDFAWQFGAWPNENHLSVQLNYVQPYFGPVVIATSQFSKQTDSNGYTTNAPYVNPVTSLSCGPIPSQVTAISAAPNTGNGSCTAETVISWTPVIATGDTVAFAVSVTDVDDPDYLPRRLGVYSGSSVNALLTENTNYIIQVKALNKYGESAPTTFSYRTHSYLTAELDVTMFSTRPNAWYPDGRLAVYVNSAISGIGMVLTDATKTVMSVPYLANGQPQSVSVHFVPPSGSAGETSFIVSRHEDGTTLFNSGQTTAGPTYYDGYFTVTHAAPAKTCSVCCLGAGKCSNADPDGYCCDDGQICCQSGTTKIKPFTCCSGAQKCLSNYNGTVPAVKTCAVPVATCPDTQPSDGAACYGVLSCTYNTSCCCPGDTDQVCGPTVKFQCTGEAGSTWTQHNLTLPCQNDPAFACPSACPSREPSCTQQCLGTKTCLFGKTCCCPDEPDPNNQLCTYQHQWKCTGSTGASPMYWTSETIVPSPCPALCYSQTKAGTCPVASGTCGYSTRQDLCQVDAQCNGTAKCCAGLCGNVCVQPCDCSTTPTCQQWEKLQFTAGPGCCGGNKTCVTDPTSTQCLTTAPDWSTLPCVLPAGATWGTGTQTRTINVRDSVKGCLTNTQTQQCNVPGPVNCTGSFGSCGQCSSPCVGGTCQRTYKINTPAANNGAPCPYSDGALSTPEPCANLPPCPAPVCPIRVVVKDYYGDGWTNSGKSVYGNVSVYDNSTNQLIYTQYIKGTKLNQTSLLLNNGTVLKLVYNKDPYFYEDIILITQNENNVQGAVLYQDPLDISKWGKSGCPGPKALAYYTVSCYDCSALPPATCLSQHRQPCSVFTGTCGACVPGYYQPQPGGPCVDIDECAQQNNLCAISNATCNNIPGSFTCACPAGQQFLFGYCETPGVCPTQRFRMEWFDMTTQQRQLYADAWKCLSDTGMYQSLWTYHSGIPNGVGYPSPFHYGHDHGSGFWYWHRTFYLKFEDMVRQCAIIKNIPALRCFVGPYWDSPSLILAYDTNQARSDALRNTLWSDIKDANGNNIGVGRRTDQCDPNHPFNFLAGGPPACWTRGPDINDTSFWPGSDVQWGMVGSSTNMQQLTNLVGPHFAMHTVVGGVFAGVESARDPLFFLHHGYYDMLWETWKTCRGKNNWADASPAERWWASVATQDYPVDSPIQGFTNTYPQDVWDNSNIQVRQSDGTIKSVQVVYSSSSFSRATAAGQLTCPTAVDKYVRAGLTASQVTSIELQPHERSLLSVVKAGGRISKKTRDPEAVEVPPPSLWHARNKATHPEANTEWRESIRRLAGGAHTAEDRHLNVLSHTWRVANSALGKEAWLETRHLDNQIQQDIGQQCRAIAKTMAEDPHVSASAVALAALNCECEATEDGEIKTLDSEFLRMMHIEDLCLENGCTTSICPQIMSMTTGKAPPRDDSTDSSSTDSSSTASPTATDSPNANQINTAEAQKVLQRLSTRLQGKK